MTDGPTGWEFDLSLLGNRFRLKRTTSKASDIEVCTTRIVRGGRGFPWDEWVAVHPMPDGSVEVTELRAGDSEGEEHPC